MSCCTSLSSFGCYCYCDDTFTTAINPTVSGLHTLEFDYHGHKVRRRFTAVMNDPFELPNIFNEDGKQFFRIRQPDGTYFTNNGADCFYLEIDGCSDFTEVYKECAELFDCSATDETVDCL